MFVILVYDVNKRRVAKIHKICRKYLLPVQNSVFEGDITAKQLSLLKEELRKNIDFKQDSVCIYELNSMLFVYKSQIGAVTAYDTIL